MKVLLLSIALLFCSFTSNAGQLGNDKPVKDTVINKVTYKLYIGNKGGKYIIVTSKTGTQYKKYFKKG